MENIPTDAEAGKLVRQVPSDLKMGQSSDEKEGRQLRSHRVVKQQLKLESTQRGEKGESEY